MKNPLRIFGYIVHDSAIVLFCSTVIASSYNWWQAGWDPEFSDFHLWKPTLAFSFSVLLLYVLFYRIFEKIERNGRDRDRRRNLHY
jgi:hypothetical protein